MQLLCALLEPGLTHPHPALRWHGCAGVISFIDDVRVVDLTPYEEEAEPRLCSVSDAARNGALHSVVPAVSPTTSTIRGITRAPTTPCSTPRPMFMGPCQGDAELWAVGSDGTIL